MLNTYFNSHGLFNLSCDFELTFFPQNYSINIYNVNVPFLFYFQQFSLLF